MSIDEINIRFKNLNIPLTQDEIDIIRSLRTKRNRIEHFKYTKDQSDFYIIGKSIRFVYFFVNEHFEKNITEFLTVEQKKALEEIILKYEERVKQAEEKVERYEQGLSHDEECYLVTCEECGNRTLVLFTDKGNFCFFCDKVIETEYQQCDCCAEYYPADEFNDIDICDSCFQHKLDSYD